MWVSDVWCFAKIHLSLEHIVLHLVFVSVPHPPPPPLLRRSLSLCGLTFFPVCTFLDDRLREYHSWNLVCFQHFIHNVLE